ncbi:hypothetical protein RI138_31915 [Streptomyces sp. C11-1]|uniref:Phage tail sheath protein n=1 Tax=Streptomyces durocortorensis TaxID=2811104 RepID=A0ABY9W4V1_9ACTN|nr:hypothetical protein [Streptomyces durocortorensis]WNF31068.1 hypothetical protein RI138_31915 [Streptomyces durocortorensis]
MRTAVDSYLQGLWRQGGLMGQTPQEAYFVQAGEGITMTEDDVTSGQLIVKAGLAVTRPAEFVILQFTQEIGQA